MFGPSGSGRVVGGAVGGRGKGGGMPYWPGAVLGAAMLSHAAAAVMPSWRAQTADGS